LRIDLGVASPAREEANMYASIRRYVGNPGFADELAARSDEVKSVIEPVQGFKEYFLVKASDGTASITICEDESGVEESNRAAAAWIKENMPDLASSSPEITAGEIVFSTTATRAHA
jgi:heme-degrading monooxygenase HmoA